MLSAVRSQHRWTSSPRLNCARNPTDPQPPHVVFCFTSSTKARPARHPSIEFFFPSFTAGDGKEKWYRLYSLVISIAHIAMAAAEQETRAGERYWKPITAKPGRPPLTRKEQSTLVMRNLPHGCTVRDIYETWKFYAIRNRDPIVSINIEPALRMAQVVFQHPVAVEAIMRDHKWCGKYSMYDDTPREVMIDIDTI